MGQEKVRLVCLNCLHTKKVPLLKEEEPKNTRVILTDSCDKCGAEDNEPMHTYLSFAGTIISK